MRPGGALTATTPASLRCYRFEGSMLDLPAEMLQYVTRVTLDIPEWMLIWKPLPQTPICRVKVSIWERGFFFFSLHESLCQSVERWPGSPYL